MFYITVLLIWQPETNSIREVSVNGNEAVLTVIEDLSPRGVLQEVDVIIKMLAIAPRIAQQRWSTSLMEVDNTGAQH